ncbi:unnamed protein product, partial [Amoebophrya sp. A25]|eukprot:GSA25T00024717001.1
MRLVSSLTLYESPVHARADFTHPSYAGQPLLLLCFRSSVSPDVRFSILRYDATFCSFCTVSTHVLHLGRLADLRWSALCTKVYPDPDHRCLIVQVDSVHLVILTNLATDTLVIGAASGEKEAEALDAKVADRRQGLGKVADYTLHDASYLEGRPLFRKRAYVLNMSKIISMYTVEDLCFLESRSLTRPCIAICGRRTPATVVDLPRCARSSRTAILSLFLRSEETSVLQKAN